MIPFLRNLVIALALLVPIALPFAAPAHATVDLYPTLHAGGNYPYLTWDDVAGEDHYRLGRQDNYGSFSYSNLSANTTSWYETTGSFDVLCYTLEAMDSGNNRISSTFFTLCSQSYAGGTISPINFTIGYEPASPSDAVLQYTAQSGTDSFILERYDINNSSSSNQSIPVYIVKVSHLNGGNPFRYMLSAVAGGITYGHTDRLFVYP